MIYRKEVKHKTNNQTKVLLIKLKFQKNFKCSFSFQVVLPSKPLELIASKRNYKIKEQMLIAIDKSKHEKSLLQPLQTNEKQFEIAVSFVSGNIGIFIAKTIELFIKSAFESAQYNTVQIKPGAYELESLNHGN